MKHNLYKCQLLLLLLLLARNCFVSQNIVVSHETLSCFKQNCFVTEKIWFCIGKYCVVSGSLLCFRHNIESCFAPGLWATVFFLKIKQQQQQEK